MRTPGAGVQPAAGGGGNLLTTKGDLLTYGTALERLGTGTAGQVLMVGGADASGLEWATPALVLIASQVLSAPAATITFSGIPATFNHLRVMVCGRFLGAVAEDYINLRFNNDSAANYDRYIVATLQNAVTAAFIGWLPGASSNQPAALGMAEGLVPLYAGTTFAKLVVSRNSWVDSATSAREANPSQAAWRSTAAINRMDMAAEGTGGNFATGTAAFLYGIN